MNRAYRILGVAAIFGTLLSARASFAEVDVHIGLNIPPPPSIVFRHEPPVVVVPQTDVYYVPEASGYDMYRYGSWWYVNRDGYWYRSRTYNGPFAVVEYNRLPRAIVGVPKHYRHHPHRHHERYGDAPDRHDHRGKDHRGKHRHRDHDRHDHRERH
jgi:hypothetical protein